MDFWDANFLKNIGFFQFWPAFNVSKKISEYFAIAEYVIIRQIYILFPGVLSEYI